MYTPVDRERRRAAAPARPPAAAHVARPSRSLHEPPRRPTTQTNTTTTSCSPCKRIEPSYAALRRRLDGSGVTFARAVVGGDGDGGGDTSAARSPSPSPGADASSVDALAAELDVSTLPTWVCLKGGGAGEVARVAGARHKRPLQPVAAAVRWRLLLQPPSEADGDDERPPT